MNTEQTSKNIFTYMKMFCLGILGWKFEKVLSYFHHPRICQNAKFCAKLKFLTLGPRLADLGVSKVIVIKSATSDLSFRHF